MVKALERIDSRRGSGALSGGQQEWCGASKWVAGGATSGGG